MNSLSIKKGDTVVVLAGKDKGKTSSILAVSPKTNRVIVKDVNIVKKHKKARNAQQKSEIISLEAPINASNVMVVCSKCNKATRISKTKVNGKFVRVCKKCGAVLDNAAKKEAKKEEKTAKKVAKTTAKTEEKVEEKVEEKPKTTKKTSTKKGE